MADNNQKPGTPRNALIVAKRDTMPRIDAQPPRENLRIRMLSKKSK